jgi:hypothetical protein
MHERRDQRRDVPGPAAEIGDDPAGIEQAEHRLGRRGRAEQLVAEAAPLAGSAGEERLRGGAPGVEHAGQAASVRRSPGRGSDLASHDLPQPLGRIRQRRSVHGVEPARRLAPRRHPAAVGQGLQVPADGRLRQPKHLAQLRNGQLVRFQHRQDAHTGGVREHGELVEDGSGHSRSGIGAGVTHPSSRMKEYTPERPPSTRPESIDSGVIRCQPTTAGSETGT